MRVLLHDPTGSLQPHTAEALVTALGEASGLPVGVYAQGAAGSALAAALAAARAGAELIACAIYPLALTLHRVSGEALAEALAGIGLDPGVDVDVLWRASDLVDEHIGDAPVAPLAPRVVVRARAARRPDEPRRRPRRDTRRPRAPPTGSTRCSTELDRIRAETGWPPLAAPIGQVLASQALLNVLSASRYVTVVDELRALVSGRFGTPPAPDRPGAPPRRPAHRRPRDRGRRRAAARRAARAGGAASPRARRSCSCSASSARTRSGCCAASAAVVAATTTASPASTSRVPSGSASSSAIVQESGIGEVTIEEEGMRVSVRATPDVPVAARRRRRAARAAGARRAASRGRPRTGSSASSRRWSARSTGRLSRARRRSSRRATWSPPARRSASSRR